MAEQDAVEKSDKKDKLAARALGYVMIVGSTMYKLPQILRIHKAKSAAGISLLTAHMDLANYMFSVAYSYSHHHPISAYGENVPQFISMMTIIMQILRYEHRARGSTLAACACAFIAVALAACTVPAMLGERVGNAVLDTMKGSTMAISLTGSLPQVVQNWRAGSAGELSLTTSSLGLLGSWIRMYTVMKQLAGDRKMVAAQVMSLLTNSTLVSQIVIYGRGKTGRP